MAHGAASASGYRGPVTTEDLDDDSVHGVLHHPAGVPRGAVALTHGAGGNCDAAILRQVCSAFADAGFLALRFDLPFRRRRPKGPPQPSRAAEDRAGIAAAAEAMRVRTVGPLVLGGVSYGGRQTSILAAEQPDVADALVLLSYPLHPPGKPGKARTEHLPSLTVPTVFAHGDRDPFGTLDELRAALTLIPAPVVLVPVTGAAHDLGKAKTDPALPIVHAVSGLLSDTASRP
ncbi:alpha/beta family hydrolase [Rhodococcus sp. 11-3]|uniref:alpha/beta hydrolase family protein n=1 Tax=Rhodococcus sp. 11-3 TaxID=2854796 RepID=UPI002184C9B9|nr:dienelactone hydrolase family protein [Rhodococcus sp. 11-3]